MAWRRAAERTAVHGSNLSQLWHTDFSVEMGVGARSTATGSVKPEPLYARCEMRAATKIHGVRMGFRRGQDRWCLKGEGEEMINGAGSFAL